MRKILQLSLLWLIASVSLSANDQSIQSGAQMMLKIAAAELLGELTQGKIPKQDLMRFAEGMTEKYPDIYSLTDEESEKLLANEAIASEDSFNDLMKLYLSSGHSPTDLLVLIIEKNEQGTLSHGQTAFSYQYLESLNQDLLKRSKQAPVPE